VRGIGREEDVAESVVEEVDMVFEQSSTETSTENGKREEQFQEEYQENAKRRSPLASEKSRARLLWTSTLNSTMSKKVMRKRSN
jgi:cell shape-determining protein MreC